MPLYEYECPGCKKRFEAFKRLSERKHDEPCPSCSRQSKRVLSGFAVVGGTAASGSARSAAPAGSSPWTSSELPNPHPARVRKVCLALPEAHEKMAWGAPTFRVRDELFAVQSPSGNE